MLIRFLESITIKKIILGVLVALVGYLAISYFYNPYKIDIANLSSEEFDKEGFTNINDIIKDKGFANLDNEKVVFENKNYKFIFDEETTQFKFNDKKKNQTLNSNPKISSIAPGDTVKKNQSSIFILTYLNSKNIETQLDSYSQSVRRDNITSAKEEEKEKTYSVKYGTDFLQVYYEVQSRAKGRNMFPEKLSVDRMEELFLSLPEVDTDGDGKSYLNKVEKNNMTDRFYKSKSVLDSNGKPILVDGLEVIDYYELKKDLQDNAYRELYNLIYLRDIYTSDDLIIDDPDFEFKTPIFKICVEYKFEENGFKAKIINDSITEELSIVKIDFLPYFGATIEDREAGMFIVPDGSGAIMNFNNKKGNFPQISKRVYGEDNAYVNLIEKEKEEKILFPMYGASYTTKNLSFFANIEKGSGHALLNVAMPQTVNKYNRAYFTFLPREKDSVTYGSNKFDSATLQVFTKERVQTDFIIHYEFLDTTSYSDIAKEYQKYLGFTPKKLIDDLILDMNILGAYDFKNFLLGISYTDYKSLTTYEQAIQIYESFKNEGINKIDMNYLGWTKEGLLQKNPINLEISNTLGSKKELDKFNEFVKQNTINFAYNVSIAQSRKFEQKFFENKFLSKTIGWDFSVNYPFNKPTMTVAPDSLQRPIYTLSPKYYKTMAQEMLDSYSKTKNTQSIYLEDFGVSLNSDFSRKKVIFREQTMQTQKEALDMIDKEFAYLKMNAPLMEYIQYADFAKNVPVTSTLYPVFDYSIPFYQLVVSDFLEYSMFDYNEGITTSQNKILRAIETGSNLSLTMSFEDTSVLLETTHESYFNNKYSNWTKEVGKIYKELNSLNIYNSSLKSHLQLLDDVFLVTYSNDVSIIVNYSLNDFTYNEQIIASNNYKVVGK